MNVGVIDDGTVRFRFVSGEDADEDKVREALKEEGEDSASQIGNLSKMKRVS